MGRGVRGAGGDEIGQQAAFPVDLRREAGFVAGHAVDGVADLVPSGAEVHGGDAALAGGFGKRRIVAGEEGAVGVLEGVGFEELGSGVVEESGFGSGDAAFAKFEEDDFFDEVTFERVGGLESVEVFGEFGLDMFGGFGIVEWGEVGGEEAVSHGVVG